MREEDLDEVAANVNVLIQEELDVQHRLGGHPAPVEDCALCRYRIASDRRARLSRGDGRP